MIRYWNDYIRGKLLLLIFLISILACQNGNEKSQYQDWNIIASPNFSIYPIFIDDIVLLSGYGSDNASCLVAIQIATGNKIWEYCDIDLESIFYNIDPYFTKELLVLPFPYKTICLRLSTGELAWEFTHQFIAETQIVGNKGYSYQSFKDNNTHKLYKFEIDSGRYELIQSIDINNEVNSIIRSPIILNQDSFKLLTSVSTYDIKDKISHGFVIRIDKNLGLDTLNNFSININKANFSAINYKDNKVLMLLNLNTLIMYDVKNDVEIWSKKMAHGILTSRIIIKNDMIYYPCEDEHIYAIDALAGSTIWKSKHSGTPSRICVNKENIIITDGNNGHLFVYGTENGSLVNEYKFKDYFKKIKRTISLENGVILFTDGKFWYSRRIENIQNEIMIQEVN